MAADSDVSSHTLTEVPTNHSRTASKRPAFLKAVFSHSLLTPEVIDYDYNGTGTEEDPFVVEFIPDDPRDPLNFPEALKWVVTVLLAVSTLAVAFASSAFSGGIQQIMEGFGYSEEVVLLGISLFVLGVSTLIVHT